MSHNSFHHQNEGHDPDNLSQEEEQGKIQFDQYYTDSNEGLEEEDSESYVEPAGFLNDLRKTDWENDTIDLSDFFPINKATAIAHNRHRLFHDMKPWKARALVFPKKLILVHIGKPSKGWYDCYPKELFSPSILATFSKKGLNPRFSSISLISPLNIPEWSIDIRNLAIQKITEIHTDIFLPKKTFLETSSRFIRRRKKFLIKHTRLIVFSSFFVWIILVSMLQITKHLTLEGYTILLSIKEETDIHQIQEKIKIMERDFALAHALFRPIGIISESGLIFSETLSNANHAINAGYFLAESFTLIDTLRNDLLSKVSVWSGESLAYFDSRIITHRDNLTDFLAQNRTPLEKLRSSLHNASLEFGNISDTGSNQANKSLIQGIKIIETWEEILTFYLKNEKNILESLWHRSPKHYLVLNQNRDELRPNGWFAGSVLDFTFYKWKIEKFEKKDIYFYDWRLFPYGETPPPGIDQITKVFGMRDVNYFYNFDTTFSTLSRMYERAGWDSLDGIFAINQGLLIDLLKLTGPIRSKGIHEDITAENFSLLMSVLVEWEVARSSSAKDILFSFMESFFQKIPNIPIYELKRTIEDHISRGEVLVAMRSNEMSEFFHALIPEDSYKGRQDNFVYPVFTSLWANKSDRYISRKFILTSKAFSGCSTLNHFEMKSTSTYSILEREYIRKLLYEYKIDPKNHEHELFVQWNGTNKQYIRLVVPKWSKIVWGGNVALTLDESDRDVDVISFMIETKTMENSNVVFDYLSNPSSCEIRPYFLAQPGLTNYHVEIR